MRTTGHTPVTGHGRRTAGRRWPLWTAAVGLGCLTGLGCPPNPPADLAFDDQVLDAGGGDGGGGDVGAIEARVVPTMDGTWLQLSQISTCIDLIETQEGFARTLFIIEVAEDEQHYVDETWTACRMELPAVLDLDTFATEALRQAVYPVTSTDGYVTNTAPGGGYTSGLLTEVWGIDFEDRLHDPFPETVEDPRIIDADLDGNPGVTVLVSDVCETYLVQRAITGFQGVFVSPDRIEGTLVSLTDQLTVGASQPFCGTSYDTRPNDGRSVFSRIRIDGQGNSLDLDDDGDGEITCDEVLSVADRLFERLVLDDSTCLLGQ